MAALVAALAALFAISAPVVFADAGSSLNLTSSSPEDGSTNLQPQNVGVKLYFDGDVTDESLQNANAKCFKFTYKSDGKTKELPIKAYSDPKVNKGYILAIVDTEELTGGMLANNASYALTVSGDLRSSDGRTLGADQTLKFRTVDQSGNTTIYMLLMVAMVGVMITMTILQNKRKESAAAEVAAKGGRVNPYKLAKDKKISVKEAMELIERDRKKRLKRLGIAEGKDETAAAAAAEKSRDTKRVKRPRPISATGSSYKYQAERPAAGGKRGRAATEKNESGPTGSRSRGNAKQRNRSKKKGRKK